MSNITNIAQVLDAAPPTPACFPDRLQWSQVLLSAQKYTKARVLPFSKAGIYQPEYSFCRDCTTQHAAQMALAGKCNPNKFRADVLNKELA
ncbi:hypothetical protein [Rhodoferax ferrireducens]|uniref:hypothetical protein n=1 Tax=Rhodoferax ferrireducens TaxID=192843 RepID=UPI000E0D0AE3|nr:hypothetical protein [Rhodoferax ferrireducens]